MRFLKRMISVLAALAVGMTIVGVINKPGSIYKNKPEEKNPMEGKKVRFVKNDNDKENADGVCGHLEAVGKTCHNQGIYEKVIKRIIDAILSFCGLVVLSPVFLIISIWIIVDDPGPILFTQKRVGKDKQYFKLHNIFEKAA